MEINAFEEARHFSLKDVLMVVVLSLRATVIAAGAVQATFASSSFKTPVGSERL